MLGVILLYVGMVLMSNGLHRLEGILINQMLS